MTLIVHPYTRDKDGKFVSMGFGDSPGSEMAGFESCRHDLWGHEAARSLGLTLLPSLSDSDVYAEGDDLDRLDTEVQTVLHSLDLLSRSTGFSPDYIELRCRNILEAIGRARAARGGVYIG